MFQPVGTQFSVVPVNISVKSVHFALSEWTTFNDSNTKNNPISMERFGGNGAVCSHPNWYQSPPTGPFFFFFFFFFFSGGYSEEGGGRREGGLVK